MRFRRRLFGSDPNSAADYVARGLAYEAGEYHRAIVDFSEAIRLNPEDAEAYGNRGATYCSKGELDKAIADFTELSGLFRKTPQPTATGAPPTS